MQSSEKRRKQFQKCRKQLKLTQRQASFQFGITESHFRNIETGRGNPDAKLLFKMANYFGVSAEELFPDLAELKVSS